MVSRAAAELLSQGPGGSTDVSLPRGDGERQKMRNKKPAGPSVSRPAGIQRCRASRRRENYRQHGSTSIILPVGCEGRQQLAHTVDSRKLRTRNKIGG
jgi:hypothetical protein